MNDPLISVIVPVYKVEKYLDECVESIVNQTYRNLEIILVDDGSPDNCPQMCDDWAKRDARIRVIHKENGGLSSARNAGLDVCTGEYISFIDSDDWLELNAYEELIQEVHRTNCPVVMFGSLDCRGTKQVISYVFAHEIFEVNDLLELYLYHRHHMCGSTCDKMYRREFIQDIRYPLCIQSEDYVFLAELYFRKPRIAVLNKYFYHYRIRENSICTAPINAHTFDSITVADMVCELLQKKGYDNMSGFRYFKMQARHDVLYSLVIRNAPSDLIRKYTHELRKYYWSTIRDKNVSAGFKCKLTLFCISPRIYEKVKQTIRKR